MQWKGNVNQTKLHETEKDDCKKKVKVFHKRLKKLENKKQMQPQKVEKNA